MLHIQRLNMDNSWWLDWGGTRLIIDPWLTGSEIDGGRWFNEQWHATPPVSPAQAPPADAILVSQSYNDHCHLDTIGLLPGDLPLLATPKPLARLRKAFPERECRPVPLFPQEEMTLDGLSIRALAPRRRIDPIYYAVVIRRESEVILIAPHGFELDAGQVASLQHHRIRLLITTFATVELPAILGGKVNPGLPNARRLVEQLQPDYVVNTHDEQKHARGIIMKIARTNYPELSNIQLPGPSRFVAINDYEPVSLQWRK